MQIASDPVPDRLQAALEAARLRTGDFGQPLVYFSHVESTNDVASTLATQGAPHGTLVLAAAQSRGRGRQGRTWFSPPGAGLYFSLVLRPPPSTSSVNPLLTLAAGVAVVEGIDRACGLHAEIKWPNDVVVIRKRKRRKLAGILAEGAITNGSLQHVILGIGINVRAAACPPDLAETMTSLAGEMGSEVDADLVLAETLAALADRWSQMTQGREHLVLHAWRRQSPSALGAPVSVATPEGGCVEGTTAGVAHDGALWVDVQGTRMRMVAGEVEWL